MIDIFVQWLIKYITANPFDEAVQRQQRISFCGIFPYILTLNHDTYMASTHVQCTENELKANPATNDLFKMKGKNK